MKRSGERCQGLRPAQDGHAPGAGRELAFLDAQGGRPKGFAGRRGGKSVGPYSGLNVSPLVGDDPKVVSQNLCDLKLAVGVHVELAAGGRVSRASKWSVVVPVPKADLPVTLPPDVTFDKPGRVDCSGLVMQAARMAGEKGYCARPMRLVSKYRSRRKSRFMSTVPLAGQDSPSPQVICCPSAMYGMRWASAPQFQRFFWFR